MSYENDPPERIGSDPRGPLADPKPKRTAPKPVAVVKPLAEEMASPTPPVQTKSGSHPKHAIARPVREHAEAVAEVDAATAELRNAKLALTDAEIAETEALQTWLALQPKVDADALLRDYANRSTETRAANIAAGLPAEGVRAPTHGNSVVDVLAAQRSRQAPGMASNPLRSPVSRRRVV